MKATKVFSLELLIAMEPQITKAHSDVLCEMVLAGIREYLTAIGYSVEGGSARSVTQLFLEGEPGDDLTQLARSFNQVH
ncbi:MAG: hypothetical protein ACREBG_08020 [Pyrinomonadaceae bacterium]